MQLRKQIEFFRQAAPPANYPAVRCSSPLSRQSGFLIKGSNCGIQEAKDKSYIHCSEALDAALEELRQKVNRELKNIGYHLQVDNVQRIGSMVGHDLVKPVDLWADELPDVMGLVETRILKFMAENG